MEGYCSNCGELFKPNALVKVVIHAYWIPLKSKVVWSLSKPTEYEEGTLQHVECPERIS